MEFHRRLIRHTNWQVSVILAFSLALRWVLAIKGGQYFFPDEVRYLNSLSAANAILQGDLSKAIGELTISAINIGYRAIALFPALAESYFHLPSITPAIFFSFFSVLNLYLIWKIALRIGMSEREAYFALLFAAVSHSLLYFSRHLFPYDLSLFFGLLALYVGLDSSQKIKSSLVAGVFSFLCFICYNGYWPFAAVAIVLPSISDTDKKRLSIRKALPAIAGFTFSLILFALFIAVVSKRNVIKDYIGLAGTVSQGSFSEGWSLPFEYLWQAEHTILVIVISLSLYAAISNSKANRRILATGLGGAVFIYLCLSIPSTGLQVFVVYGRLARQLVPFLAISAAQGLSTIMGKGKIAKQFYPIIFLAILAQGVFNYRGAYMISYPREFIAMAQEKYPSFKISLKRTYTGAPPICKYKNFVVTNIKFFYPLPEPVPVVQGDRLLSAPHPMNYKPYQYEGNTPETRKIFRDANIKMELYLVDIDKSQRLLEGISSCIAANP